MTVTFNKDGTVRYGLYQTDPKVELQRIIKLKGSLQPYINSTSSIDEKLKLFQSIRDYIKNLPPECPECRE